MSNNSEQYVTIEDPPMVMPGAVQVHSRAMGQYPRWARQQQQQLRRQTPLEASIVPIECTLVEQPIVASACVELSSEMTNASMDDSSSRSSRRERRSSAASSDHAPSKIRFPRVFRKKNRESKKGSIKEAPLLTTESGTIPDNPMDVNPRREVAAASLPPSEPRLPEPSTRIGSRRNVLKLMRGLSSRGQFLVDRVKEIFPLADEDRVVTLQQQGKSVRAIVGVFAEESANTASTEDSSSSNFCYEDEQDESGRGSANRWSQEESVRVLQIMEVFPDAPKAVIKEQLEHKSVELIIQDLVDQSC